MNEMRKLIDLGSKLFESSHDEDGEEQIIGEVTDPIADLRYTRDDVADGLTDAYKHLETIVHLGANIGMLKRDLDQARKYPERYHWTNVEQHISRLSEITDYLKHQAQQQLEHARSEDLSEWVSLNLFKDDSHRHFSKGDVVDHHIMGKVEVMAVTARAITGEPAEFRVRKQDGSELVVDYDYLAGNQRN